MLWDSWPMLVNLPLPWHLIPNLWDLFQKFYVLFNEKYLTICPAWKSHPHSRLYNQFGQPSKVLFKLSFDSSVLSRIFTRSENLEKSCHLKMTLNSHVNLWELKNSCSFVSSWTNNDFFLNNCQFYKKKKNLLRRFYFFFSIPEFNHRFLWSDFFSKYVPTYYSYNVFKTIFHLKHFSILFKFVMKFREKVMDTSWNYFLKKR